MTKTKKITTADIKPKIPISLAIFSSFAYNGVNSSSPDFNIFSIFPMAEFSPTLIIITLPSPLNILVPAKTTVDGTS